MAKKTIVAEEIIGGLREFVDALRNDDVISEKFTCRKIVLNLPLVTYNSKTVKATRQLLTASQPIFAQFLGVSPKTVRAWEQGKTQPSIMACRFLDEIRRNPEYWRTRLKESIIVKV